MKRLIALTSLCAFALSACQPVVNEPIKIGYIGPLTGDASFLGVDALRGVQMKVKEINASGGIDGCQVEIIAEDGRCTGADAASAAQKLIHIDKVVAIVGGDCSGETLAAAPIAEAAEVVMVSPVSSSPDVTEAGDFVFRNYPSDALKTKAMASYFSENEIKKVAIITENVDFCVAFRDALKSNVDSDVIVFDEIVEPGTKDYRTLLTRLKDVEFDAFFPNATGDAVMATMIQQFREQDFSQLIITHDVGDTMTLYDLAPDAVVGMRVINVPSSGEGGAFEEQYVAEFGESPNIIAFVAHAYDALGVLAEAIAAVGTDGPAIRDYLYDLDGYDGIVGRFRFDENGDVVGIPYALKEFKDGKIVKIADIAVD